VSWTLETVQALMEPTATPQARAITSAQSAQRENVDRVVMTAWARGRLDKQDYDSLIEQGGALFGFYDVDKRELVIDDVTGRVSNSSESSGLLDVDYIDQMARRHRETTRYRTVGIWHTHPSGGGQYSRADEKTFAGWWRDGGEQPFVGLILSKSDERTATWAEPRISAYTLTRSGYDAPIISRAPVKVEPEQVPLWRLAG
jgi:hypothetical protein